MRAPERRARFAAVHLYLVTPLLPGGRALPAVAAEAVSGGVDAIQVRDKDATDAEIVAALRALRPLCDATGTLLIVNDHPDLAVAGDADGVHVGQDDVDPAEARRIVGDDRLVGLSTHSTDEIERASLDDVADHLGVGPVYATPTKAGREPVGLDLVAQAASRSDLPFVAIGGIDATTVKPVVKAGARRVAVVRAIADADDPRAAASLLRAAVDRRRR